MHVNVAFRDRELTSPWPRIDRCQWSASISVGSPLKKETRRVLGAVTGCHVTSHIPPCRFLARTRFRDGQHRRPIQERVRSNCSITSCYVAARCLLIQNTSPRSLLSTFGRAVVLGRCFQQTHNVPPPFCSCSCTCQISSRYSIAQTLISLRAVRCRQLHSYCYTY